MADTGEWDSDCLRCHELGSEFDEEGNGLAWRSRLLRELLREKMHAVLCWFGRHVPHDFCCGDRRCVWCFADLGAERKTGGRL
jgi:hypothetical protein